MNRRIKTLGAAVVISGVLMITSACTAISTTSAGYEAFKTAHKQANNIDSLTMDAQLIITDGGQSLVDLQSTFKFDSNKTNVSSVINVTQNGETSTINGYLEQGQLVLKTSGNDTYFVMEHHAENQDKGIYHKSLNPVVAKGVERIIDVVVGNYQNYFQFEEGPGNTSVVILSMHDDEIPRIVDKLGSILIKNASKEDFSAIDLPLHPAFTQMHAIALPELTEDIQLNGIEFTTVFNADQFIEQYDLRIQASGKDAKGVMHELELQFQLNFSDFNQTEVDVVDLAGKQVEKLELDQFFE